MAKFRPNVYRSVDELLDPANHVLKMLELSKKLNRFLSARIRFIAVLACISFPLLNTKEIAAYGIMAAAKRTGQLKGVRYVVDSSSGNFAIALAQIVRSGIFGNDLGVIVIVPEDIPPEKLDLIRTTGAIIIIANNGMELAKQIGQQPRFLYLRQYANEENPWANQILARGIHEGMNGLATIVVAGLGSSGTTLGLRRGFNKLAPNVKVVGVACVDPVSGVRSWEKLEGVTLPWKDEIDFFEEVSAEEAHRACVELHGTMGIQVGPSSGLTYCAAKKFVERHLEEGDIDQYRNRDGEVVVAIICADNHFPYVSMFK